MIRLICLISIFLAASVVELTAADFPDYRFKSSLIVNTGEIYFDEEDSIDWIQSADASEAEDGNLARDSIRQNIEYSERRLPQEKKIRKPWPTGALLLSAAIPGGGQFYNRKYIKTILYGGTELYLLSYVRWRWKQMDEHWRNVENAEDDIIKAEQFSLYERRRDSRNIHIWLTALVVFVSMFDAYVDAHLADFDQPDKAFDVFLAPEDDRIQLSLVYNFR